MIEKFTREAARLEGQPMFRLLDKVQSMEKEGRRIIHFEIGDPDFDSPAAAVNGLMKSLQNKETHYTSSYGLEALRQAIARYTQRDLGFTPNFNQILVAPGANALIYFVIQCLVNPEEEVIVPDPAFSTYYSVLKFLNRKAIRIALREEQHFRMSPEDIRSHVTHQTKLIILNSPQNPTGAVMTEEEMKQIYTIAEENDLFILSDEIYRLMTYTGKASSPSVYDQCKKRTIVMTGFSKAFAMTGWRLGYMIAPSPLVEKVSLLLQTIVSCVSPFVQQAGVQVLENHHLFVEEMMAELRLRRDTMVEGLNRLPGVSCVLPQGAFYAFANIRNTGMASEEFAHLMLNEGNVALLPGTNFGEHAEGYVRLCYATSIANITEGLRRMQSVLERRLVSSVKL